MGRVVSSSFAASFQSANKQFRTFSTVPKIFNQVETSTCQESFPNASQKINLIGLTLDELKNTLVESLPSLSEEKASRVFTHIYTQGHRSFQEMKGTLSKNEMNALSEMFEIQYAVNVCLKRKSPMDSTLKYLFELDQDKKRVEGVVMHFPEKERITMCVSSQVGCSMNCSFCHTVG